MGVRLGLWSLRMPIHRIKGEADSRPIDGQPIYWDITAPARYDGTKSVTADVRLLIDSIDLS